MILDLSIFRNDTLDVALPDGRVAHVRKPSQRMVIELMQLNELRAGESPERVLAAVNGLVLSILNDNVNGLCFCAEEVADMRLPAKTAILNAYARFITELQANPI